MDLLDHFKAKAWKEEVCGEETRIHGSYHMHAATGNS